MLVNGDSIIVVNRTISGQLMSIVRLSAGASLVENCMNLKWFSSKIGWVYWKLKLYSELNWNRGNYMFNSASNWNCILKVVQLLQIDMLRWKFLWNQQPEKCGINQFGSIWYHKPSINYKEHHLWWSGALFLLLLFLSKKTYSMQVTDQEWQREIK